MIVDNAIYVDRGRAAEPRSLQETYEACREGHGVAWIGLYRPTQEEFDSVAGEFNLHPLAVEDAITAHQRPKLERYGETLFVVLRAARYIDESETVEFGEIHVFVGTDFVVTIRHGEAPHLREVRSQMEGQPELLRRGPAAILYPIMDRVVDDYEPVVVGLQNDIDEIETEVFSGNAEVSRRTYELSREVIEFQRAVQPLGGILGSLTAGFDKYGIDEEVKRISAWAAILFAPTLIGTVYGMNFVYMPELHWALGYPFALLLMLAVSVSLYAIFRHRGWI